MPQRFVLIACVNWYETKIHAERSNRCRSATMKGRAVATIVPSTPAMMLPKTIPMRMTMMRRRVKTGRDGVPVVALVEGSTLPT